MKNITDILFENAKSALERLSEHVKELQQECDTEAEEERVFKALNKLLSAIGIVREAYDIMDVE